MSSNQRVFITSCKTTLICINATTVAPNLNALIFIVFFNTSLHATPYHSMCTSLFQQITKMYDMLNKKSLGLLKKGAVKQSRINSTVKLGLSLWLNRLVRPKTDIRWRPSELVG